MKAEQKEWLLAFLAEEYRLQKEVDKLIGRRITEQEEADFCTCCLGFYEYVEEQLSR